MLGNTVVTGIGFNFNTHTPKLNHFPIGVMSGSSQHVIVESPFF
jgi:hypothetical protein